MTPLFDGVVLRESLYDSYHGVLLLRLRNKERRRNSFIVLSEGLVGFHVLSFSCPRLPVGKWPKGRGRHLDVATKGVVVGKCASEASLLLEK